MVDMKLIAHKQKVKAKKPNFCRQETHRRAKLGTEWRKPKGVHSKLRLRRRGKGKMVSIGYRMPEAVRGLTVEGLRQVYVSSPEHIKYISKEEVALMRKVSNRTRLAILQAAQKANARVLNVKDIAKKIEELTVKLSHKKVKKEAKTKNKLRKEEEEKKKAKMSKKQAELKQKGSKTLESTVKPEEPKADEKPATNETLAESKPAEAKNEAKVEKKPVAKTEAKEKPSKPESTDKKEIKK
jgi:large subunit ribosomal protein L32e